MNILYIAYSCKPNKGSEEKIGWHVPLESAKHNNVFVITRVESRESIEEYLKENPTKNIKFYYVDIPKICKKLFDGIMIAIRLNIYHKKAYPLIKKICEKEKIDIIHQITPIEFRSVGNFEKIPNVKVIYGPLGGGEHLPKGLKMYAKGKMFVEYARKILNIYAKIKYKLCKRFSKCDYVLFANNETYDYLSNQVKNVPCQVCFDNGISETDIETENISTAKKDKFVMLVAGRLAYRKGHKFLLDVLKDLPKDLDYECRIIGEGPELLRVKEKCKEYNLEDKVVFTGRILFEEMAEEYRNADVFVMPSIRETTGAVLLEAMSKGLPVITINKFGGAVLFDNDNGYLYDGNTIEEYKEDLKKAILDAMNSPENLRQKSEKLRTEAQKYTWSKKIEFYNSLYKQITER